MTDKLMYFGNRTRMTWVRCPAYNTDLSTKQWTSRSDYLNGGVSIIRSGGFHKEYTFTWNLASAQDIAAITDYETGIYGDDLIYFLDPFAAETNAFPAHLAAPGLAVIRPGSPSLRIGTPLAAATPTNAYGYPVQGARYTTGNAGQFVTWLPVPQGYKIALGVTGSGSGLMRYQWDGGVATDIPYLSVTSGVRANLWLTPPVGAQGINILMPSSNAVTVYGMFAQIVPSTEATIPASIANGPFISGRGHSGCRFEDTPQITGYSSVMDKVGATARLIETGSWER